MSTEFSPQERETTTDSTKLSKATLDILLFIVAVIFLLSLIGAISIAQKLTL